MFTVLENENEGDGIEEENPEGPIEKQVELSGEVGEKGEVLVHGGKTDW